MDLRPKPADSCRWDCVALGEVMLRFDPEWGRIRTTRHFRVSEGGGEYNVARALNKVFGMRTSVVTALVDNEVGHLIEDLMMTGGVDLSQVKWVPHDGIGLDEDRVGIAHVFHAQNQDSNAIVQRRFDAFIIDVAEVKGLHVD